MIEDITSKTDGHVYIMMKCDGYVEFAIHYIHNCKKILYGYSYRRTIIPKNLKIRAKCKKSDDCGKDVDIKAITMPELERLG